MKKFLLSAIAVLLVAAPSSAQYRRYGRPTTHYRSEYRNGRYASYDYFNSTYYGFRLGFGVSTVNSDSKILDSNSSQTGLNAGFVIGTRLTPSAPLFFESGLYYTEKGGESNYKGSKFTYGLNYLEVPLLLKYKAPVARDVSIEPFFGGFLACGVGGKIKDYDQRQAYDSFNSDYNDNFNRFDGGIKLGCGASFQMFYLEASYDIGLANVGKDNFDDTRTGCFNLTFGVNF
jgi:hypothetical protein